MILCEKCGRELAEISIDMFAEDGSDGFEGFATHEKAGNVVEVETSQNWTGYELSEEEMPGTIRCPHCGAFPFENTNVQIYSVVRLIMFKQPNKAVFSKTYEFTWSGKPYFARVHVFRNIFRGGEFCPASADVIMRGTDASGRKEVLTAAFSHCGTSRTNEGIANFAFSTILRALVDGRVRFKEAAHAPD